MEDGVVKKLNGKTLATWSLVPCEIGADSHVVFRFGTGSSATYIVLCCREGKVGVADELKCPICDAPVQYGSGFMALRFDDLPVVRMYHERGGGKLPVTCPHCGAIYKLTKDQAVMRHAWRCRRCKNRLGRADFKE